MKNLMLLTILLIPLKLFAPNTANYKKDIFFMMETSIIEDNLRVLKNDSIKSRKEVFKLAQQTIEIYLNRMGYKEYFPNLQDSISYGLACIFVSESSNSKGQSARSSLWLKHNNPFGLTSNKGTKLLSWELINGERVITYRTFQTFISFQDAINSLILTSLSKRNFNKTRNSYTVQEFLFNLQKEGYCTNTNWPYWAFNQIYLKYV